MNPQYDIAYSVLGPIFRFFCFRLRLIELHKRETPMLFLSRGGLRLRYYYERYLEANGLKGLAPRRDFYVSRSLAFRALLASGSNYAAENVSREYSGLSGAKALRYFLPESTHSSWLASIQGSEEKFQQRFSKEFLLQVLVDPLPHGEFLRNHAKHQNELLTKHFRSLADENDEVLLVDTGWSGSIIRSLQELFPVTAMTAAFFGRYNYGDPPPDWFDSVVGLVMQNEYYRPNQPQSSLVFHRHLIESICEPAWPSTEYFVEKNGSPQPASGFVPSGVIQPQESEPLAKAVGDYILDQAVGRPETILRDYHKSVERLARLLTFPSAKVANQLSTPPRPADFGRADATPVLLKRSTATTRLDRVRESLWRQGQVALEYRLLRLPFQTAITFRRVRKKLANKTVNLIGCRSFFRNRSGMP